MVSFTDTCFCDCCLVLRQTLALASSKVYKWQRSKRRSGGIKLQSPDTYPCLVWAPPNLDTHTVMPTTRHCYSQMISEQPPCPQTSSECYPLQAFHLWADPPLILLTTAMDWNTPLNTTTNLYGSTVLTSLSVSLYVGNSIPSMR